MRAVPDRPGAVTCTVVPPACAPGERTIAPARSTALLVCEPCSSDSFVLPADTTCTAWTTCVPGYAIRVDGTTTSDRACEECASGFYQPQKNQPTCPPWDDCAAGFIVGSNGTSTSSRTCTQCSLVRLRVHLGEIQVKSRTVR